VRQVSDNKDERLRPNAVGTLEGLSPSLKDFGLLLSGQLPRPPFFFGGFSMFSHGFAMVSHLLMVTKAVSRIFAEKERLAEKKAQEVPVSGMAAWQKVL
jgi:hypothetical protein